MSNILLLYDTKEKDLARDFEDFLKELNIGNIRLIPLSADKGFTLEEKEKHYFDEAIGAIFIITQGSERLGSGDKFPSPSVSHEMGQAKQKFKDNSATVIYLVDSQCNIPAIDQKSYIPFKRDDVRSVVGALTQLLRNLKSAALLKTNLNPKQFEKPSPTIDLNKLYAKLDSNMRNILFDISNMENGIIEEESLNKVLLNNYKLSIQQINFLKRDFIQYGVLFHKIIDKPSFYNCWILSDIGWEISKLETSEKRKNAKIKMEKLIEQIKLLKK